jgi:hypothetical protein
MGLPLAALGLWSWLARGQRRAGLLIACAGFAWSVVALKVVVPASRDTENVFYGYYASVGGSPGGMAKTLVTHPGAIAAKIVSASALSYAFWLAAPLLGLFALAPGLAAIALPQLLLNVLSDWSLTTDPHHHYLAAVVPFFLAASVLGVARLPAASRVRAATAVFCVCVGATLVVGPWPGLPGERNADRELSFSARHVDALRAAVALVPNGAPVSATNRLGSHLSARRYSYSVPVIGRSDWILIDESNPWLAGTASEQRTATLGRDPDGLRRFVARLARSDEWRQVFQRDGVRVFARVGP